jgi:hypothetical protein
MIASVCVVGFLAWFCVRSGLYSESAKHRHLRQIESVQVRGSEDVTRVEHLLEKGGTVIWADVKPATVLSVFVRGVRALPKSARVFSGDRDFKRLQKALRVSDKVEGLASVRQKLDPKKRDLLQVF